jgi:hypothetical protein
MGGSRSAALVVVLALPSCSLLLDTTGFESPDLPPEGGTTAEAAAESGADGGASAYAAMVLSDQPIVYWRMGTTTSDRVPDETGRSNDLLLAGGGHALVEGPLPGDSAIEFNGSTSTARATDARPLDFTGAAPFTVECWLRRAAAGGDPAFQHVFNHSSGAGTGRRGYFLYFTVNGGVSRFEWLGAASETTAFFNGPPAGTWVHAVSVFDGAQALLYFDGVLGVPEARTGDLPVRTSSFVLGAEQGGGDYHFAGAIDEVAVYGRALGAQDVTRHLDAARSR